MGNLPVILRVVTYFLLKLYAQALERRRQIDIATDPEIYYREGLLTVSRYGVM